MRPRPTVLYGPLLIIPLAVLLGCAGGATASGSPPATAPGSPPAASPVVSPEGAGQRVLVSGSQACDIPDMTEATKGQVTTYKGAMICTDTMSDPRVTGRDEGTVTIVKTTLPDLEIDRWSADMVLTNDGGTWRGTGWGSEFWDAAGALRTSGTALYVGEGRYQGLVYRVLLAQSPDWKNYILSGWIEPAG